MKDNNILKHFTTIGIGTLINMVLGFLTTPIITRIVSPDEYGQFSIFTMYSNIALLILCLGLDQALVRYYYENKTLDYKKKLLFRCVKLPIIISCILTISITLLSYHNIFTFEFNTLIIALLCIYTSIQVIYRFSLSVVRLEHNSKLYSILNILLKLFYIIIVLPLLLYFKDNKLLILIISTILSSFFCVVISIFSNRNIWNFTKKSKEEYEIISQKKLLKYAYPFIISMGVTTLFQAIDKISLNYFYSYAEVGIYSSAITLVHIFGIIQTTFNTLWMPIAIENYTNNPENKELYKKGNRIITVIMFFIGILLILFKDLFAILLGSKYREAAYILPFLIFNPIMYTISETTVGGLVFKEKSKMQVLVALGACATNIVGNIILVPKLGCQGAAISTGISYIIFFTLRTILANKYYYIDFKLKKFYFLTVLVSIYALYNTFYKFDIISIIGCGVCLIFLFGLYSTTVKEIYVYIRDFINNTILKKRKES